MAKKPKTKNMKIVEDDEVEDPEFPDSYEPIHDIKSPLNVLFYNLNFNFKDKYPAKMPPDFARDMIELYSKEGDVVWDCMCGSGTVPRMANSLNRIGVGTDVNPKAIELAKKHDNNHTDLENNYQVEDARTAILPAKPDLILFSPPFGLNIIGDINRYSDEPRDISNSKTYDDFYVEMGKVIQNMYHNLKAGGMMIIDSRDRTKDGIYRDLGVEFRNLAIDFGFQVVCRYWYLMIPYRQMTYKHRPTKYVIPMVSAMDAYVFYKPVDTKLD